MPDGTSHAATSLQGKAGAEEWQAAPEAAQAEVRSQVARGIGCLRRLDRGEPLASEASLSRRTALLGPGLSPTSVDSHGTSYGTGALVRWAAHHPRRTCAKVFPVQRLTARLRFELSLKPTCQAMSSALMRVVVTYSSVRVLRTSSTTPA